MLGDQVGRAVDRPRPAEHGFLVLEHELGPASANVFERLFSALGEMEGYHQAPIVAADRLAGPGRVLLGDAPLGPEVDRPAHADVGAEGQDAGAILAGHDHAGRRLRRGHDDGEMGLGVGPQVEGGLS